MATISTIKPDGTGDYTSLATWEDAVDGSSSADQHAECYSGGDLGGVTLNGWSATPTSELYPRIYAAAGNGHNGSITSGAFINASFAINTYLAFTRIEGLRINNTDSSNIAVNFNNTTSSNGCRAEELLIHGSFQTAISMSNSGSSSDSSFFCINNIIIIDGSLNVVPIGIYSISSTSSTVTTTSFLYNNTIYTDNQSTLTNKGIVFVQSGNSTLVANTENNVAIGNSYTTCFSVLAATNISHTFNNNISSDTTAGGFSGTANQVSKTQSQVFTDADNNNFIPVASALDAGKTIPLVQTDAIGTIRPYGQAYDVGALEYFVVTIPPKKFVIPDTVVQSHEFVVDALLEGPTGHNCELIYPVTKNSLCPNCVYSPRQRKSSNIYKSGGPIFFKNHTICPWCGGVGRSSRPVTETIKLRIYWSQKDWIDKMPLEASDSSVMIIGFMKDLPKVEKCDRILLNKDVESYRSWLCEREGESVPWGLSQDRYFAQMLRRVAGG
tara:strand:+ start:4478 stop:5968 length:1491 start_codon:yes stop_codon:yes gene_type:complete